MNRCGGIILNEDNSHYFFTRAGQELDEEKVSSFVDQYANTQVCRLLFCPNCMRTSYASKVWDPIWFNYDPNGTDTQPLFASLNAEDVAKARGWVHTAWQLDQNDIDPYKLWIDRARQHGISPWISMRMNDVHNVDDENSFIHSEFWRENPQFRRITYDFQYLQDRAFDYAHKEVVEFHLKLVREFAERWDMDGLELDWMRFGFHFQPGHEQAGCAILTEFTREVRRILDDAETRVGHAVKLSARVPARPQTSLGLGMDAITWAEEGLIDSLVVTPFWASADTDMPIELWKKLLGGADVELAAGLEILLRPYPDYPKFHTNSLETARGMAASFLDRGADKIYLFNYMDSETALDDLSGYGSLLKEIGSQQTIADKPRRHVVTFTDTWAVGQPPAYQLPAKVPKGGRHAFRIHVGELPIVDRALIIIGLLENEENFAVYCNGAACTKTEKYKKSMPFPDFFCHAFLIPEDILVSAYNTIELIAESEMEVGWVEVKINT